MSAEVEVFLAEYENVMTVPVTAVVESVEGTLCWVSMASGEIERRTLLLGDSDDVMIIVESGIEVGEKVVLNPRGAVQDARDVSLMPASDGDEGDQEKNASVRPDENQNDSSSGKAEQSQPRR